jgi:Glycosyl hydrolases family 2, TIM barrel domain/Glycosyl hydrolases family 2, sugar binding domain/Glycosyl hydrolases family 2/Beta galactosidase small chain
MKQMTNDECQMTNRGRDWKFSIRHLPFVILNFFFVMSLLPVMAAHGQETQIQFLSGHGKDDAVPWKFFCTSGAQSGYWTNLPVPSNWELHGFGTLNYFHDLKTAHDERGLYEHEFSVPQNWSGKRIFLVFEGAMTDTSAKLNGQSVGPMHQGGYYQFQYEVTSFVKCGATNKLEVTVAKHSANASVNRAERDGDFWVYGGIYRPVYLQAVPPQFIERVAIDARADGNFSANVFLNGVTNADEVEAQIQTLAGDNVGEPFRAGISGPGQSQISVLKTQIAAPKLWTAETPNLYRVELRLEQNGQVLHRFIQRFGFRTMEVRDGDGLYVNGHKVILKGADRHSFWPDSGRCLSEAVQRLDINTMKDANMNAVRMSHYPPDGQFLDLCDEMGLYVLDELAGWHHYYDNDIGPKLVREMVERDVNHPCILFWDNGNEGGFNTNLDHLFGEFDPQHRRVLHPWATFSGLNTAHYLAYDKAEIAATGRKVYFSKNQELVATNDLARYIYMPTEFLHGLYDGGAGAGLDDYWRMMMSHPTCAGGFIWALLDEGVKRPDTGEIDVAGNQAPDGIVGPYRQREGSYYTIKEIWSPIQVMRPAKGVLKVENHYSFTDARDCKFFWQLRNFASPLTTNAPFTVLREGVLDSPAIPPGQTGILKLPSAASSKNADALALRVDDSGGRELWTWVWPLRPGEGERLKHEPAEHHAIPMDTNGVIEVAAGELTATFSKQTGLLLGVRRGAQIYSLTNGPRLAVGSAALRKIHFAKDGPDAFVAAKFDGDLKEISWRVNGNGWIDCDYTYRAKGTNDFIGVLFDYPESLVRHKRWLGDGPYRVWKNRRRGVTLGVWENDYNNTITGWRDWIYPEFKGFFAGVRWLQLDTAEGQITVLNNSAVPFVQVLTPEFPPANLVGKAIAPVPDCGLGFLDAIPPIGSKFKEARFGGPQGQPNVAHGEYTGSVSFYFGKLP